MHHVLEIMGRENTSFYETFSVDLSFCKKNNPFVNTRDVTHTPLYGSRHMTSRLWLVFPFLPSELLLWSAADVWIVQGRGEDGRGSKTAARRTQWDGDFTLKKQS